MNIEKIFWNLFRRVDPDLDLAPTNIDIERNIFFSEIKSGRKYCPSLTYRNHDFESELDNLELLLASLDQLPNDLQPAYKILISNLMDWISMFSKRGNDFDTWLFSLFGDPQDRDIELAHTELQKLQKTSKSDNGKTVEPTQPLRESLQKYGFCDWKVEKAPMAAKMRVSSLDKTLYIATDARFTQPALDRLIIHELETHILRHENGLAQKHLIFAYGFPEYLETEEGLAIFSEWKCDLLSDTDYKKYCLRLIAANLASSMSFHDIYQYLVEYTNSEEAFAITLRVKRGLIDTNKPMGYSKDQVYFSGFQKLKQVNPVDLKKLYVGKIGLKELDYLDFSMVEKPKSNPSWLP